MSVDDDDAHVTYSVRDLLKSLSDDQKTGFARVEKGLESKADKADITKIETRLDAHARDIGELKQWRHEHLVTARTKAEAWSRPRKVAAGLISVGLVAATVLGPYLANHLH